MSKKNLFQRLADAFRNQEKETSVGKVVPTGYETQIYGVDNSSRKQKKYLQEMKGWVGACVSVIADEVASTKIRLYKKEKGDIVEVTEHPILDLIYKVNSFTTRFDHFWLTEAYLELAGEAPWFLERNAGKVTNIFFLQPDKLTPIPDKKTIIGGYKYDIGRGETVTLTPDEVIFLKNPNPAHPFRGLSTLSMASKIVDIDNYSEDWNSTFYENSARPDSILKVNVTQMDDEQKTKLKKSIKDGYQGITKAHQLMVLFGDMDIEKMGASQKDMDFLEQQKFSRDKILGIFRVPKAILSQTEGVNFASAKVAQYIFARYCIKPKLERLIQQLNEFLLPQFDSSENLFLDYDNPVPEDKESQAKIFAEGLKAGYLTTNEVRAELGLQEIDGGDIIYIPMNLIPLGDSSVTPNGEGQEGKKFVKLKVDGKKRRLDKYSDRIKQMEARSGYSKVEKKNREFKEKIKSAILSEYKEIEAKEKKAKKDGPRKILSDIQIREFWGEKNDLFLKYAPKTKNELIKIFHKQRKETLPKLNKYKMVKLDSNSIYNNVKLNVKKETNRTLKITVPIFEDLFKEAGDETFKLLELDREMDVDREEIQELINTEARTMAINVTKTTNEFIKKEVIEGIAKGESIQEISDRIKSVFVKAEEFRANRIARTETLKHSTRATEQAFVDSEIVEGKMWVVNPDACPQCQRLSGATAPLGKVFLAKGDSINGIVFDYEDIPSPPLHVNCECDLAPIFKSVKQILSEVEIKQAKVSKKK